MTATDERLRVLNLAISALEDIGADYWICNGTLLGLIRDDALIPWDTDIDIGIFDTTHVESLTTRLQDIGMVVVDEGPGSDYIVFGYGGIRLDFNIFHSHQGEYRTLWRVSRNNFTTKVVIKFLTILRIRPPDFLFTLEGYRVPQQMVTPTCTRTFFDLQARIPHQPEPVLEYIYGPSWHTPQQDYDWRKDGANNALSNQ